MAIKQTKRGRNIAMADFDVRLWLEKHNLQGNFDVHQHIDSFFDIPNNLSELSIEVYGH